ncbi:RNA methyltransferase [Terrihabitans rhizophilus]|uniref:tRNA (cytidine/uridine-2'-O-)-methyltransferase TrmJ n=1 Tax=Terrihabitans rhizophilus TaxID=3092662 RepID=A0ABU4RRK6_9HYPH|nr:RNA methyltransferase [Terrihabitans sp. PJ23]MDX6807485.1 RNA methyltransferase [Terrihabitans sp. PJ23]
MAGTNRTRHATLGGPAVILVEPQLPENIGSAARAMTNFGLTDLRLVRPQVKLPHPRAEAMASGAVAVLEGARVFDSLEEALSDLQLVYATTARERGQAKPVDTPAHAAALLLEQEAAGARTGIMFGRERTGLENDEVSLADRVLTFPVNPAFASLNLSQAVLLVGYEWFKASNGDAPAFEMPQQSPPAEKRHLLAFFAHIESALDRVGFFYPETRKPIMVRNLRNIFHRLGLSEQDLRTLHGAVAALEEGERGPSRRDRRVLGVADLTTPAEGQAGAPHETATSPDKAP